MFSMKDIQAHTFYRIFLFIPNLIILLFTIFACPFVAYLIGFSFVDNIVLKITISIFSFFVLGIVWTFIVKTITFFMNQLFDIVIDVTPSKNLSDEESRAVLLGGQAILDGWEFDKNIRDVSVELVERISKRGMFSFLFENAVSKRLWAISEYYKCNPNESVSLYMSKKVLKDLRISCPWYETALTNINIQAMIYNFLFFVYLLVAQPNVQ